MRIRTLLLALGAIAAAFLLWSREPASWTIRNAAPGDGPIICFGDSLTRGFGTAAEESYPAVLGRLLGREVLNRGRDGETAESALERLEEDVIALSPSVVIVTLGGNDMLRRVPIAVTVRSLRELFERTLAAGAMVVFVEIDPPFVGPERMDQVRGLSRALGVLHLASVMDGLWGSPRLMSDRIHPSAAGYRLMAERVRDALEARL
ncbi:MAG: GDSL-type esterase/lipase family protein [Candidatus Binatia bacterium]